ncbi:helix-turn-helix domain-containing protein [Niallia circulans]|uniref:Helix-turn-helix domain-containing protein n=1 Tax=Niallia circulans TaxID=1397 RepID=A0A553STF5_NIACI|nr:helix-turn-helix domain-containing protein [Niallia circulans]TRZ40279.1 helix-turn-helix domain-containing protein [Niallia circulans]
MTNMHYTLPQLLTYELTDQKNISNHYHREAEFLYILKGTLDVKIDKEEFKLFPEDLIVINSTHQHSFSTNEEVLYVIFHINYQMILKHLRSSNIYFLCNSSIDDQHKYSVLKNIIENILKCYYEDTHYSSISLNMYNYQLVECLVKDFSIQQLNSNDLGASRKNDILVFVEANYQNPIGLKDLADFLFLSPAYVSKYFKEVFGMNFYKFLNEFRLNQAVKELKVSKLSITSIAMNNGFPNVSSFNKVFKEKYQTTPHDFRTKHISFINKQDTLKKNELIIKMKKIISNKEVKNDVYREEVSVLELDGNNESSFNKYWKKVINLNKASRLLGFNSENHIIKLKKELGFEYGRIWDLFSSELMILEQDLITKKNFFNLERIFDFLMDNKIKPYIVLNPEVDMLLLETNDKSQTLNDFLHLFKSFVSHIVNRYGIRQVKEWYFEISGAIKNDNLEINEFYFTYFNNIKRILNEFSPGFKVGGAGIPIHCGSETIKELLIKWHDNECKPDYLTLQSFPDSSLHISGEQNIRRLLDGQYIKNQVLMVREISKEVNFEINDIQLSIWNFTLSQHNFLNDSSYKAAYIIKNIIDCYGLLEGMGYWFALDSLSSSANTPLLLYGSPGLLSNQGLRKPSYYAYAFLNIGEGKYYLGKDDNSFITSDGTENYFIVCQNVGRLNYKYYLEQYQGHERIVYSDIFEQIEKKVLNYRICNVKNGTYKVKIQSVNEDHGNIQQEWFKLNSGMDLSKSEIDYLRDIALPRMKIHEVNVENGTFEFETILERNEIQSIRITYQY